MPPLLFTREGVDVVEKWRYVENTNNMYKVSNTGKVFSYKTNKLLKNNKNKYGYEWVSINGKCCSVHRLVAEAFIPNPNCLKQVNHKDENKLNNSVENLEWCSQIYNINYGTGIEKRSKKVNQYDLSGKFIKIWKSTREAERVLHISHSDISKCCNGKKKSISGFMWKYD